MSEPTSARHVGVLGLGAMGSAMAARLIATQAPVVGYDPDTVAMTRLVARGGRGATTPAECSDGCAVLVVMVRDAVQADATLFGPSGAVQALADGSTVWLASTVPPAYAAQLERRLRERGIHCLDGPVSGGVAGAEAGRLTVICAGSVQAQTAVQPLLPPLAQTVFTVGDQAGAASSAKMINQMLTATHIAVTAEALTLAMSAGLDPTLLHRIVCASAGTSRMFETRAPRMLSGEFATGPALDIFRKDLGIALDEARRLGCPSPISGVVARLFDFAAEREGGDRPDTVLIHAYAKLAALPPEELP